MVQKSHGFRIKTRKKLRLKRRFPKVTVTRYLAKFEVGDKVVIRPHPSVHEGMPHPRFMGRIGTVVGTQGRAYIVEIRDGDKVKKILAYPIHLRKVTA